MVKHQDSVSIAEEFARRAHEGQVYGDDSPYIEHLARVAGFFESNLILQTVAWLHDIVEDTDVSLETIENDFGYTIRKAVDAITRRDETYSVYLSRIEDNYLALHVKMIDLADNLSNCFNVNGRVKEEYRIRQKRYVKAIKRLLR